MISRIADHCFWLGRYLERAESTARLLPVTRDLALDSELTTAQCWYPVVVVSGEETQFASVFEVEDVASACDDADRVERFMTWDARNAASIYSSVRAARWNAQQMREVVSLDVWQITNELYLWVSDADTEGEWQLDRDAFYAAIRARLQLCLAQTTATMLHDEPLDFIWLGAMLERASQSARILDVQYHAFSNTPKDEHVAVATGLWLSLLRSLSGFEPFMKRHRGRVGPDTVARFLVSEVQFPRSLRFCVRAARARLQNVRAGQDPSLPGGEALAALEELDTHLATASKGSLAPESMHQLLTHVVDQTHTITALLGRELFGYAQPASQDPPPPDASPADPVGSSSQEQSQSG